jgi:hypothetical protein
MPGQDFSGALIKICTAQTTISQYAAVIRGTAEDTVKMASAEFDPGFYGFALQSASSGATVQVHMDAGIALASAGSPVTAMSYGVIADVSGRLENFVSTNTNRPVVCQFLRDGVAGDVVPVLIVRGQF